MKHLFLTGDIQVGKSTLLQKWLSRINCRTAGFYTRKVPDGEHIYVRIFPADSAFTSDAVCNIDKDSKDNILFDCTAIDEFDFTERFDRLGSALLRSAADADLIVMDEIGLKEDQAEIFCNTVLDTLNGTVPVIGVLRKLMPREHNEQDPGLIDTILGRSDVSVIEVTEDSRDALADTLPGILQPFA